MRRRNSFFKKSKNVKSLETTETPQELPVAETPPPTTTGQLAVSIYTALGALPVEDALVTVYVMDENGEEQNLYVRTTDENGKVSDMVLGVFYDPNNPLMSQDFYFTTYNLRVQAINYYTENIFDFRIYPDVKSTLRVNLVPVKLTDDPKAPPERTIVIPSSPVDAPNR